MARTVAVYRAVMRVCDARPVLLQAIREISILKELVHPNVVMCGTVDISAGPRYELLMRDASASTLRGALTQAAAPRPRRLHNVVFDETLLYLVFEHLEEDLRAHLKARCRRRRH